MPTLRWSLFCGEALPYQLAQAWQVAAPSSVVENLYGPTEVTIACSVHRFDPSAGSSESEGELVPIGRVYDGLHHLVLDDSLQPAAAGQSGELCVAGPQTFSGYWRDHERSEQCMVERAAADGGTRRYYRTGDRVRQLSNGDYVFLGRIDRQVKILGFRVELGEIESVLRRTPGVEEAVALPLPASGGSYEGVVACVTGAGLTGDEVRVAANALLPPYMALQRVVVVDLLPRNANGKVDLRALYARLDSGA